MHSILERLWHVPAMTCGLAFYEFDQLIKRSRWAEFEDDVRFGLPGIVISKQQNRVLLRRIVGWECVACAAHAFQDLPKMLVHTSCPIDHERQPARPTDCAGSRICADGGRSDWPMLRAKPSGTAPGLNSEAK